VPAATPRSVGRFPAQEMSGMVAISITAAMVRRCMCGFPVRICAVQVAERVRALVSQEYGRRLPNEEIAFLALHIARVQAD
ncbi:MAG: PRD domain-containing protein, partial [Herbiconiux sp.]|nr:PRD domain-containing protein [Herbiconiux sp.]